MMSDTTRMRDRFTTRIFTLGMEAGGFLSLAGLFFAIPGTGTAPFLSLTAGLLLAAVLGGSLSGLRIRRLWVLLLHNLGFVVWLFFVTGAYPALPFAESVSGGGIKAVGRWFGTFGGLKDGPQWAETLLLFSMSFLFWFRGYRIGIKHPGYPVTVRRFDTAFGILLTISLIRMGFRLPDPDFPRFVLFSILSGTAALISAKNLHGDFNMEKIRSPLGQGLFFIGMLIPVGAAVSAFYPLFVRAAEKTYAILQAGAETAQPWLIRLLLFLFQGFSKSSMIGSTAETPPMETLQAPPAGNILLEKILSFIFFLFVGAGVVLIVSMLLYRIALYLLQKTGSAASTSYSVADLLRALVSTLRRFLRRFMQRITDIVFFRKRRESRAGRSFRLLLRWGLRSGLPHRRSETPLEYGRRLAARFPTLAEELLLIVGTVQKEFYGAVMPTESETRALAGALRRLRSPALLPARLKSLLFP